MTAQACTLPGLAASVTEARDFTRHVLAAAGVPAGPDAELQEDVVNRDTWTRR